jgi:hypothetical protein
MIPGRGDRRFAPGWCGGPGRPPRATQDRYLAVLTEAVPPETWRQIVETAVEQAVAGDSEAREWLGSYLIGKPSADDPRNADDISLVMGVLMPVILKVIEKHPEVRDEMLAALEQLMLHGPMGAAGDLGSDRSS